MKTVDIDIVKKKSVNTSIVEAMISLRFAYETVCKASDDAELKDWDHVRLRLIEMEDKLSEMSDCLGKLVGEMFSTKVDEVLKSN